VNSNAHRPHPTRHGLTLNTLTPGHFSEITLDERWAGRHPPPATQRTTNPARARINKVTWSADSGHGFLVRRARLHAAVRDTDKSVGQLTQRLVTRSFQALSAS